MDSVVTGGAIQNVPGKRASPASAANLLRWLHRAKLNLFGQKEKEQEKEREKEKEKEKKKGKKRKGKGKGK